MLPWWWSPQRMMSNSVPEREKEILTGCVSFYTQWIDVCVCIRVRWLHLVFFFVVAEKGVNVGIYTIRGFGWVV